MQKTGWETLPNRRKKHKLFLFYKMQHEMSSDYLASLVPPTIRSTTSYQLRNSSDLLTLHASSQLYFNSFLPSVIGEWNELPEITRELPSIATFKHELNSDKMKIPTYYFDGNRISQIYHVQLKTNCSSLNEHLFPKNIKTVRYVSVEKSRISTIFCLIVIVSIT